MGYDDPVYSSRERTVSLSKEVIVFDSSTERQEYHTKLLLLKPQASAEMQRIRLEVLEKLKSAYHQDCMDIYEDLVGKLEKLKNAQNSYKKLPIWIRWLFKPSETEISLQKDYEKALQSRRDLYDREIESQVQENPQTPFLLGILNTPEDYSLFVEETSTDQYVFVTQLKERNHE